MSSSPRYEPYQDDSDEDVEVQATSSSSPDDPIGQADNSDVEQGAPILHHPHQESWFSTLRNSMRNGLLSWPRQAPEETENQGRE